MPRTKNSQREEPAAFLTTYDIAEIFHVSVPTARKWIKAGKIKNVFAIPGSRELRVPANAVLSFANLNSFPVSEFLRQSADMFEDTYNDDGTRKSLGPPSDYKNNTEDFENKVINVEDVAAVIGR